MDILNFALQFEHDGEVFYRDHALKLKDRNLADILLFLAAEEQKHYQMIKDIKGKTTTKPTSIFLSDIQNIFSKMDQNHEIFVDDKNVVTEILEKALEIENQSIRFYERTAKEAGNATARDLLLLLKRQEDTHYSLLSSIIEYYETPHLWLENAEFNHLKDY